MKTYKNPTKEISNFSVEDIVTSSQTVTNTGLSDWQSETGGMVVTKSVKNNMSEIKFTF